MGDLQQKIDEAVAAERQKWEKVLESANKANEASSEQLEELTKQVGNLRQKLKDQEASVAEDVTKIRLECLEREKNAVRRVKDESEQALILERQTSEAAMIALGEQEEKRIAQRLKEVKKEWDREKDDLMYDLAQAQERLQDLEKSGAEAEAGKLEQTKDQVRRERKRVRKLEQQLEEAKGEVEQLKLKLVEKNQVQYQGSVEDIARESPEVTKLYKQMEQYKKQYKSLQTQLDAVNPSRVVELQGSIKMHNEECGKLKDEIKTLNNIVHRQEKIIKEKSEVDDDYAQKVQSVMGDLQVAKEESRRLKEKLDIAEKGLKSRQAIEESLRQRAEKAEKKVKALDAKLKDSKSPPLDLTGASGEEMDALKTEVEMLKRKCQALEGAKEADRKLHRGKIKEKTEQYKNLQLLLEQRQQEAEAKEKENRAQSAQIQQLQKEKYLSERELHQRKGEMQDKSAEVIKKMEETLVQRDKDVEDLQKKVSTSEEISIKRKRELEELKVELADKDYELNSVQEELKSAKKKLEESQNVRKAPTSLAEMAEMPHLERRGSSKPRSRPRTGAGEKQLNTGMEILDQEYSNVSLLAEAIDSTSTL